jgi:uncharacterized delta-60 repeat protein
MKRVLLLLCVLAIAGITDHDNNAMVQLDATFGPYKNGTLVQPFVNSSAYARAALVQSDGKLLVFGTANNGTDYLVGARYTAAGVLDTNFGTQGTVKKLVNDGLIAHDAIIQADGKIVVAGATLVNNNPGFALVRFNTDGTLDTSWGYGGVAWCTVYGFVEGVVIAGEKAVGVATTSGTEALAAAIARQGTDGFPDLTFGEEHGATKLQAGLSTRGHDISLQSTGKIIIVGDTNVNGKKFYAARFNAQGTLDETFASGGVQVVPFPNAQSSGAITVAIQDDDYIVIAGSADNDIALMRLTNEGLVDTAFGDQGFVRTPLEATSAVNAVTVQSDGKIVIAGSVDGHIVVARYSSTGTLDETFGDHGIATTALGSDSVALSLALQDDGKLVVAGESDERFFVARYRADNSDFAHIDSPVDGSTITSSTFAMTGSASRTGLSVRLKLDNTVIATTRTNNEGNWNAGTSSIVSNGAHTLVVDLLDANNNVLATVSNTFTINASDTVSIVQPIAGSTINTNKPLIGGQSSRSGASVILLLNGVYWVTATTDSIGNWQVTLPAIGNGSHTLTAILMVDGSSVAQGQRSFTASQYLCDNLRILGGIFTTGNPPLIIAGSGTSCPPTCDFSVQKIDYNTFNVTYGYPFSYPPLVSGSAEKIRSTAEGFMTIVEAGTLGYVVVRLHGKASCVHFIAGSCRG